MLNNYLPPLLPLLISIFSRPLYFTLITSHIPSPCTPSAPPVLCPSLIIFLPLTHLHYCPSIIILLPILFFLLTPFSSLFLPFSISFFSSSTLNPPKFSLFFPSVFSYSLIFPISALHFLALLIIFLPFLFLSPPYFLNLLYLHSGLYCAKNLLHCFFFLSVLNFYSLYYYVSSLLCFLAF